MTEVDESKREFWLKSKASRASEDPYEPQLPLKGGGGGGTSGGMVEIKDYIDARDDAVESRLSAKIDAVLTKLDGLPTVQTANENRQSVVRNIWGGAITVFVAMLAAISFGGDRFDSGLSVSPHLAAIQSNQAEVDKRQDAAARLQDDKLDIIINQTAK